MFGCSRRREILSSEAPGFSPARVARAKARALRSLLATLALVVIVASPHAQIPVAQVTIVGRVVAEATGQPVRRAYVIAHGPNTKTTRVTMSDLEGGFKIEGLPADRYRVGASKRPLLSTAVDATGAEVVISLPTGAVVTGIVTDHLGRPESGIEMNISGPALPSPQVATTNHQGEYRFFSLPSGAYTIGPVRRKGEGRSVTIGPAEQLHLPTLSVESADPPAIPGGQAPSAGGATVAGVVTDARTGEPLANAPVVNRASRRRVMTDANGRFLFDGLGAATWEFLVEGGGFLPTTAVAVPLASDTTRIVDVALTAGRNGSIAGTVRDEVGDPVVNMPVVGYLKRVLNFQPMMMGRGHARTDDRGMFDMRNLPPGDYLLCACAGEPLAIDPRLLRQLGPTAPDAATVSRLIDESVQTFAPTYFPGLTRASDSQIVAVDYGDDRTGMNITMSGVKPLTVSGQLLGTDGQPADRMQVFLTQDGDLPGAIGISGTSPVNVGADGRFRFTGLPPATYSLGAVPVTQGARTPWAVFEFTVTDRDRDDLMVTVGNGLAVTGRVEFSGSAIRPTPAGLEKARVSLVPLDLSMSMLLSTGTSGSVGHHGSLDANGHFTIEGMPPGRYRVIINVPSSPWRTVRGLTAADAPTLEDTVTVGPSGVTNLQVTVSDAASATLAGTMKIDPTRYESSGFMRVNVFPMDEAMWLEPERHVNRFTWVWLKRDGSFVLENVPPGDYYVARGSSFDPDMSKSALERWSKTAQRVTLRAGQTTTVTVGR